MSIRFCDICGNMLSPVLKSNILIYECENCRNESKEKENSKLNNLVYRNEIKIKQTELKIDNSIINDPTYARSFDISCPRCGYRETICFQNPNINDSGMKFIYLCCNRNYNGTGEPCNKHWVKIGIKFLVVPEGWDMKDLEEIKQIIYVYGFIHDKICETISKFYEQFNQENGPITMFIYNKMALDPNNQNNWENFYIEDKDIYAYFKPNLLNEKKKGKIKVQKIL